MKKAIVTGATGFVGSAVVRELLCKDIEILALGRKSWQEVDPQRLTKTDNLKYLQIEASEMFYLPERIREIDWEVGNSCIFYNFAWSGVNRLTDGTLEDQIKNVIYSANAVMAAKKLGCTKFVNAGTIEETFVEKYFEFNWCKRGYHSSLGIYAASKLAARDMCRLVAYLQKIDYVHTRFSVLVDENLSTVGFIPSVFKKILDREMYDAPQNDQLFDILPLEDGAKAYYLIGKNGKNKADYFIGSGNPKTLTHYFTEFKIIADGIEYNDINYSPSSKQILGIDAFSIADLIQDTGFVLSGSFEDFIKKVVKR